MRAMDLLMSRVSAVRLVAPGPTEEDLELMIMSAVRAPDHGRLRPWRFVIIREQAIERFGAVLADHLLRKDPSSNPEALERERRKALRAPTIVVVAQRARESEKIPSVEQMLSAGAAAQNIMLAAHALGYGAMWKTGSAAYDDDVKASLGLDRTDAIVGFIYVGTHAIPLSSRPAMPRPPIDDFIDVWLQDEGPRDKSSATPAGSVGLSTRPTPT